MSASEERDRAIRLLHGLERGGMSADDAAILASDVDPVLVYVIVRFLREAYPASEPAAHSVLERVVGLTSHGPELVRRHNEGEQDPVTRWLESEYEYADFRGRGEELIDLVVDKLES